MLDDVVIVVELADAVEAAMTFAGQNPDAVALDLEEVLGLKVWNLPRLLSSTPQIVVSRA